MQLALAFWPSLSKGARKEGREEVGALSGELQSVVCIKGGGVRLIQSFVADIRAVLGSGQDGVLSDAVVGPYCVQDATGDSAT